MKFVLFALAALLSGVHAMAQGFGADPAIFRFTLEKGKTQTQNLRLFNSSDKPLQLRLYLGDWQRDTLGNHIYAPASSYTESCARWVTFSEDFVELPAKEEKVVTVTMTLPDSVSATEAMKWTMLFVETSKETVIPTSNAKVRSVIDSRYRVAIHVYQTPPTVTERAMKLVGFEPALDTNGACRVVCQNTGKVMIKCKGQLELSSLTDGSKTVVKVDEFPMFPNQRRVVHFTIPADLPKGDYGALAILDAGEDIPLEAAESTIKVQ